MWYVKDVFSLGFGGVPGDVPVPGDYNGDGTSDLAIFRGGLWYIKDQPTVSFGGQESANSDFLLERGAAAKVNRVEDLPFRIDRLLGSKQLTDMARAARALGRPDAARRVCEETFVRLQRAPGTAADKAD